MLKTWFDAVRVPQWTKNGVVLLAWFFAAADPAQRAVALSFRAAALAALMAASFCLVSSSFYLLNDVSDADADRLHPVKRFRPVASGALSIVSAIRAALLLFASGIAFPAALIGVSPTRQHVYAFFTILGYSALQCLYSGFLKRFAYVDVAVISAGFVLRAVAGAAVLEARVSPWLYACTFCLSLFIALCKRRHEKAVAAVSRAALGGYRRSALDAAVLASAAATLAVYAAYTLSPDTVERYGTRALCFTAVPVAAGLARYAHLAFRGEDVGRPERVLLTDRLLWCVLALYCASAAAIVAAAGR